MEALDYAISKDVRNNQIVREIDHSRQRDLWRWAWIGSVILALVVYSSWQRNSRRCVHAEQKCNRRRVRRLVGRGRG